MYLRTRQCARYLSSHKRQHSRWPQRTARWTTYTLLGFGTIYQVDKTYNASSLGRNLRTFWACLVITLDYKWNFSPEKSDKIPELQERVAERVFNLLTANGGLYIKIGQSIGSSAAVLPRPMQIKFASLFDDAPQVPYSDVHDVFVKEFGRPPCGPDGVFEIFEEQAAASASIAQVHKAKLWPKMGSDGVPEKEERWVAVKIQKPDVSKQMEWDLGAYRIIMWLFENVAFDLPVYFVVDFVSNHLRQELDFIREAENARRTAELIAKEPRLRDKVYIPKVYSEYSTKRVMTAEWIDGVRLSDRDGVFRLMGETPPPMSPPNPLLNQAPISGGSTFSPSIKPLRGGVRSIMQSMVELFSAQMFEWGWVHCDPHPGNILIRPSPSNPSRPQLVLIDHGLYVGLSEDFRRDWARLWRATLEGDYEGVENVVTGWGIGLPDLMASFTLLRPTILRRGRKSPVDIQNGSQNKAITHYERSVMMKKKLKEFLLDTDRMPKELIFLSKNMRMVQGNNQLFRSPVNRIRITGYWASRSQLRRSAISFRYRLHELYRHLIFQAVMLAIDITFYANKVKLSFELLSIRVRNWCGLGNSGVIVTRDFEEDLERQVRVAAKDYFGVEIGEDMFVG